MNQSIDESKVTMEASQNRDSWECSNSNESSPPYSPRFDSDQEQEISNGFLRSPNPSPESTSHMEHFPSPSPSISLSLPPLENVMALPVDHPPSPWALHPIVDASLRWGDVTPSRATEMVRASQIARYFGDRERLDLPAKAPVDVLGSMKEAEWLQEAKERRDKATEEIESVHKQIQRIKLQSSPGSIIDVQRQEIVDLLASLTNNFHVAFSPNPKLPPKAIDPEMAHLLTDLVGMYTKQLQENMELMSRRTHLPREDGHPHQSQDQRRSKIIPFSEKLDVKMRDADWNDYRSRNYGNTRSPSSNTPPPSPMDQARMFSILYAQRRSALGPVIGGIGHYLTAGSSVLQGNGNRNERVGDLSPDEQKSRLRQANIEKKISRLALEGSKRDRLGLREQIDRLSREQTQARVEIYQLRHTIDELRKQHQRQMDAMSDDFSDQSILDAHLLELELPEEQVVELQRQAVRLKNQIQKAQGKRDIAVKAADAAERRVRELEEEVAALHAGGKEVDAVQARHLRARDRQIDDLLTVRDNLRAEVIRRRGRVVGACGEVTRERYDPARWEEAGRREQEGKPQIYRDAWGPGGEDNIMREEWPPEYHPGDPAGEGVKHDQWERVLVQRLERALKLLNSEREGPGSITEQGDRIDEALASLWCEITAAYQGIREMFPEVELEERECLAGLARIVREEGQRVAEKINGLRAENKALASTLQALEQRLKMTTMTGIRGGGQKDSWPYPRLRLSIPRSPENGQPSPSSHDPESLRDDDSSGSTYTFPRSPAPTAQESVESETRAGKRTTRNPAPVYCAPSQRKRKAAGGGGGEPTTKKS